MGTFADIGRATIAASGSDVGIRNRKAADMGNHASVTRMLQNPVYIGKSIGIAAPKKIKQKMEKSKKRVLWAENYLLVDGLHEPIISEELWNLASENETAL